MDSTEVKLLNQTASSLFANSYMSAARQLRKLNSFGSGFVVKSEQGKIFVLTNKHVVEGENFVTLTFQREEGDHEYKDCKVVAYSDSIDAVLIAIPQDAKVTPLPFTTQKPTDGLEVWSAGFPDLGDRPSWQLGKGIIPNTSYSNLEVTDSARISIIQHTAQVDPGSSGGPLLVVGKKGYEVIGVNTYKARHRENVNLSLKASDMKLFLYESTKSLNTNTTPKIANLQKDFQKSIKCFISTLPYSSDSL